MSDAEEWTISRLAHRYAQALDWNRPEALRAIFTDDAVIEGALNDYRGIEQILLIPAVLRSRYRSTVHSVHNQSVELEGKQASGETYCIAHHLRAAAAGGFEVYDVAVRYQERYAKRDGVWRFTRRTLIVDWTETRPVEIPAPRRG